MPNSVQVTIDIFSGRPNPVLEFKDQEAKTILDKLQPGKKIIAQKPLPSEPILGYRGMIINQIGEQTKDLPQTFRVANGELFGTNLAHKAKDETFEDFICGTNQAKKMEEPLCRIMKEQIKNFHEIREKWVHEKIVWPPHTNPCKCAPLYEPTWWNVPAIQPYNNCYNYGTNYRSNTFAQPGRSGGAMYTSLTCASVKPAALKDDLIDSPTQENACPKEGHLVALVIWPNYDFHWYRKGQNGYWSHKPGGTAVTNVDNSGHLILDPRNANRGGYTDFCGFMVVKDGHIKIS